MRLVDVTLNNIRRRKGRLVLLILGLVLGVGTVVALMAITGAMQTDIARKMDEYGANILIVPKSSALSLSYGGVTVAAAEYDVGELRLPDLDAIRTISNSRNISVVAPKLLGAIELAGQPVLMAGVRFPDELRLKQWWHVAQGMSPSAADDALAGQHLAEVHSLVPGSTVDVNGHTFRVVGLLAENGSQDDDILFVDLDAAERALGKRDSISLVEVSALCTACPVEEMVKQIGAVLPQAQVTAMRQAVTLRMNTVDQLGRFALLLSVVVIAIGGLVVLTTMLGAVAERRQEIGLFRALGFRQRHVMQVILGEVGIVSLGGGALGWLLGMGSAMLLAPRLAGVSAPVPWSPLLALAAVGGALLVGLLAGLYPAVHAARLDPTIALRSL